ncbi:unnamed protein product [Chilo suppressalis]|uniref:Uncharacterized protein n=1 Tax=Chilo suppressalis TaxID=168631 RepID=A0ABN8BCH4_CHISP|nr:unnamed protein product [Chilo suppressalis]
MHPQINQDTTNKAVSINPHPVSHSMPSSSTTVTLKQSTLQVNTFSKKNVVKIDEKLTLMIATDFQPFSVVEDSGFKNFVEALCPDYKIPDKRKIRYEIMARLYKSASAKLKDILNEIDNLSLTSDLWMSRNMEAFLTVTAHFFYNGLLRSCVLTTTAMPESHTAENLAEKIKAISSEWGIEDKIIAMIWDAWVNKTKIKARRVRSHMAATGGGPAIPGLTEIEEKILYVVGSASITGFTDEEVGIDLPAAAALQPHVLTQQALAQCVDAPGPSGIIPPINQPTRNAAVDQELQIRTPCEPRSRAHTGVRSSRSRPRLSRPRLPVNDNLVRSLNENNALLRGTIIEASNNLAAALISMGEQNLRAAEILAAAIRDAIPK